MDDGAAWVEVVDSSWEQELKELAKTKTYTLFQKQWWVSKGDKLGSGAFGKVLWVKHKDAHTQLPRAAKVIQDSRSFAHRSREQVWATEWHIHKMVTGHPNIVGLLDVYLAEGTPVDKGKLVIIMELCDRNDLRDFIHHYADVHVADATTWMLHMCTGLKHLHSCSVMHRDIKPGNCLLSHQPQMSPALKLADFGASAVLAQTGDDLHQFHRPQKQALLQDVTTFRYAAPEVLRRQNYNFSADVWGAGVIGWEMLQEDPREAAIAIEDKHRCDERVKAVEAFQKQVEANAEQAKRIPLFHLVWSMVQEDSKRPSASNTLDFAVFAATATGGSARPAQEGSALAAGEAITPNTKISPPAPAIPTSQTLGGAAKPPSAPYMSQGAHSSDMPKQALDVVIALRDLMPHLLPGDVSAFNEVPTSLAPAYSLLVLLRALAHLGEVEPDLNQT